MVVNTGVVDDLTNEFGADIRAGTNTGGFDWVIHYAAVLLIVVVKKLFLHGWPLKTTLLYQRRIQV